MLTSSEGARRPVQTAIILPGPQGARVTQGLALAARIIARALTPYSVDLSLQGSAVRVSGDEVGVSLAERILQRLCEATTQWPDEAQLSALAQEEVAQALKHDLACRLSGLRKPVRPLSLAQLRFLHDMIDGHEPLVIGVGATGSGKTHLAVAAGLHLLATERVATFVVTRPRLPMDGEPVTAAVRADATASDQFVPVEDELRTFIGPEEIHRLVEAEKIEFTPIGRLRGRTFNDSFILVDEAQNLTIPRMRMAVTRLGSGSRMAVTGDPEQIDLPQGEVSGLAHLIGLAERAGLARVHRFGIEAIVRNDLVMRLEALYAQDGRARPLAA